MAVYPYAISIFASRETTERALRTIADSANAAVPGSVIEVLVNGNAELATALGGRFDELPLPSDGKLRLWNIQLGDKANAWNQYFHYIWARQELVWFVDGYVSPDSHAFQSMRAGLKENSQALGASGVPSTGRSAARLRREMLEAGGFHGNLCCIRGEVIERIVGDGVRLPLGTYWVDGLIGSLLHFNLDPARFERDLGRVWVDPRATWAIESAGRLSVALLMAQFRRFQRQSKGAIENTALSDFLHRRKRRPASLPRTVNELVVDWARECPVSVLRRIYLHPMRWAAYRKLRIIPKQATSVESPEFVCKRLAG